LGVKHVSAFILKKMSFNRADIDHSWPLSKFDIYNFITSFMQYSYQNVFSLKKMNAETCFTPKSFLLVLKFIEYDQIT
jgi:hypothetical protein